jgi:hypothetical protein
MKHPKIFIGPMTKNVVDAVIEFTNEHNRQIGLILSRRQVEFNGGYVNNWTTGEFTSYVKKQSNLITLQRDHSGPNQGISEDDGYESLAVDCKYLDLIHIDPWKKYYDYSGGLQYTINMIKFCNNLNPNMRYEVGTEESIRRFEVFELETFMQDLKEHLGNLFEKISYLVIQSGTSLKGNNQTGDYDSSRLQSMVAIAKKYGVMSKEHNGDYIPTSTIREKFGLQLDAINIAPEFGLIETQSYLDQMEQDSNVFNQFWQLCYDSNKWVKWVDKSFDPMSNKVELIKICGHYVLSTPEFFSIKNKYSYIDGIVREKVKTKLNELY